MKCSRLILGVALMVSSLTVDGQSVLFFFNLGLPPGTAVYGSAFVGSSGGVGAGGVLKLTTASNDLSGSFIIDDFNSGLGVTHFRAQFFARVGGGTSPPADGFSFCFANDLPNGTFGEEGAGCGLTVSFDSFDNGGGEAPAVDVKWRGNTIAHALRSVATGSNFVDVLIRLDADGTLDVGYGGSLIYSNLPIPYTTIAGGRFGVGARTGGLNDNHWIDNLLITLNPESDELDPALLSAGSLAGNTIGVCFNKRVSLTAEDEFNYTVNDGAVTVVSAVRGPDLKSVVLTVDSFPTGGVFSVTTHNILDLGGTAATGTATGSVAGLASTDVGPTAPAGSAFSCKEGEIDVVAGGSDIWFNADDFHFVYRAMTGDFDVRTRVQRLDPTHTAAKAGFVARESTSPGAKSVLANLTPVLCPGRAIYEAGIRATDGGPTVPWTSSSPPATIPDGWLRLRRAGHVFTAQHSSDGASWVTYGQTNTSSAPFSNVLLVGLATLSHDTTRTTVAEYRNVLMVPACVPVTITSQPRSATNGPCATNCVTFSVGASGSGPLSYQWFFNGSPIAGATFSSYTVCPVTPAKAGNYTVQVSNPCGVSASAVARLTVLVDTTPPDIACPSNELRWICGPNAQVFYPTPMATDDFDPSVAVSCSPPSGAFFPVGTTTVTCTATDDCTNTSTCTFSVTVVRDTSPPVLSNCPTNRALWICSSNVAVFFNPPTATDDCDTNVTVTCTRASGSLFLPGTTMVTCTATDDCGNSNSCSFTVTVIRDTTPPVLVNCPTNQTLWTCSTGLVVTYIPPTATDDCDPSVTITCTPPSGTVFPIGVTTVTCTARDDCTNTSTCTFRITVLRDTTPPLLVNCPTNQTFWTCSTGLVVTYLPPTATDDCDPSVTLTCTPPSGTSLGPGTFTVRCTATDNCGNSNSCSFMVTVLHDTTPPFLTCPSDIVVPCGNGVGIPVVFHVTAVDDRDGGVPVTCVPPSGSVFPIGQTLVVCWAADQCGNSNNCRFTVTVEGTGPPSITAQPQSLTVTEGSDATFAVAANGTRPLGYQWWFNQALLSGATNPTLTVLAARATNAGFFSVVVSNANDSASSSNATLTVLVWPRIVIQPQGQTVMAGDPATFGVAVSGTPPIAYLWHRNGLPIAAGSNRTYRAMNAQPADQGAYSVVLSNSAGTTTSASAQLTVIVAPADASLAINEIQPDNLNGITDNAGDRDPWIELYNAGAETLNLDDFFLARSVSNLTQWQFPAGTTIGSRQFKLVWADGEPQETTGGELHASFRLGRSAGFVALVRIAGGSTQIVHTVNYPRIGSDRSYGGYPDGQRTRRQTLHLSTPDNSNSLALPPTITSPPESVIVPTGSNAIFHVTASGTQPLTFQWRVNAVDIPAATASTYAVTGVQTNHIGNYSVAVSNIAGVVITRSAGLRLVDTEPPVIACPSNITTVAKSTIGTPVRWTVSATDHLDTNVAVTCRPFSGSLFPLGTTPVVCTATDESGYQSRCSFTVTVVNPPPLEISPATNDANVVLRWTGDQLLQETESLSPPIRWRNVTAPVVVVGGQNTVTAVAGLGNRFYRVTFTDPKTLFTDVIHRNRSLLAREFVRGTLDSSAYLGLIRDRTAKLNLAKRTQNYVAWFAEGDEDFDLVPDRLDKCPGTSLHTVTDDCGCPDRDRARPPAPDDRTVRNLLSRYRMAIDPDCADASGPTTPEPIQLGYEAAHFGDQIHVDYTDFRLAVTPVSRSRPDCPIFYEFNVCMDAGLEPAATVNFILKDTDNLELSSLRAVFAITTAATGPQVLVPTLAPVSDRIRWKVRAVNGAGLSSPWSSLKESLGPYLFFYDP